MFDGSRGVGRRLIALPFLCALLPHHTSTQTVVVTLSGIAARSEGQATPTRDRDGATTLELGEVVERELTGVEQHAYWVTLIKDQYARVILEQHGVDAFVQLEDPGGGVAIQFDARLRLSAEERIELVAAAPGPQRLIVKGKYPKASGGRYRIRLVELRQSSDHDRVLDEVRRLQTAAWRLRWADKFAEALPVAERALTLQEGALGPDHPEISHTLFILGMIRELKVDHQRAEACYRRGIDTAAKAGGSQDRVLGRLLAALAWHLFRNAGDYVAAEPLFDRALTVQEALLGPDHPEVADTLTNLSFLYSDAGDYVRAERAQQRALAIYANALGEGHGSYERALNHLAIMYASKGDHRSAEPLFVRSLRYWEKTFGPDHGWVAIGLKNLAELYIRTREYEKAQSLYQRALAIDERNNGPNHPAVVAGRANLASVHYYRRQYAQAKALYATALPALETAFGPNHPRVGIHSSILAAVHIALNDYAEAEASCRRAIAVFEAAFGPHYHGVAAALVDLARVLAAQGKVMDGVAALERANTIIERNLGINLAGGSERQKFAYLLSLPEQLNWMISLHVHFAKDEARARALAAVSILQRKGRVQDALSNNVASLRDRSSAEDQALLDQLNAVSSRLARLVVAEPDRVPATDYRKRIHGLEEERERLENEISRRSDGFYEHSQPIRLEAVQAAVPPGAALIEFSVYRPLDPTAGADESFAEPRYVAYVLRRGREVRWAELGPAQDIDAAVVKLRETLRDPRRKDVARRARALDERLMRPLRPLLGDATHLLVSPDGELNLIPFQALLDEEGRYLVQRYAVSYLTSGRDLLRLQVPRESKGPPVVIAAPAFGDPSITPRPTSLTSRPAMSAVAGVSEIRFAPLAGTLQEGRAIQALFPEATLLIEARATEAAVKSLAAPRLLHIATHGFFLENTATDAGGREQLPPRTTDPTPAMDNPLLRSGLAFTGANRRTGLGEDGILTALEASGLNLWGTKLIVLSACDTGVGEVRRGEGVFGLRRAFGLAGAESLVMSLWPVSDYATRTLMTRYYRNLTRGMGRADALRAVQLELLARDRQLHPYYWASFIQSGEWANLEGRR